MRNEISALKDETPGSCVVSSTKWSRREGLLPSVTREMDTSHIPALLSL